MTEATPDGGGLTFLDYLRPVWRFKFIVALVVILAAAGTYLYTSRETKIYQSSTQLYVGQSSLQQLLNPNGAAALSSTTIADQALLVTTPTVADVVRANLRLTEPPQALISAIQAVPSSTTDFVTITATSTNPALAAKLADGFAQAYIQVAGGTLVGNARSSLRSAENQLQSLAPGSANIAARTGIRQQIATLEGIVSSPPSVGKLLAPALVPGVPTSPKPTRDAVFGGAIALVLAVILSYLFDRSDRRVRRLDEVESLFALPVLATVPHVRSAKPTSEDPHGTPPSLRERFRSLRVSLDLARSVSNGRASAKVILITSALPGEGKSTVVCNLAISYREAGLRVAVLEADLRRPVLADRFGIQRGPGLGEALVDGGSDLSLQRVPDSAEPPLRAAGRIDVAVAGAPPDDPTILLTEARVREMILDLANDHDIVLIDSPPLLAVSDGLPLLGIADGTLLVVRAGTVTRPAAARLLATIERVNRIQRVHMLGIVANDVVDDLATYYGGTYGAREAAKSASRRPDLTVS